MGTDIACCGRAGTVNALRTAHPGSGPVRPNPVLSRPWPPYPPSRWVQGKSAAVVGIRTRGLRPVRG